MVIAIPDRDEEFTPPAVMGRGEFLDWFASVYRPGEHVTFIGPTNSGKTTVAFQMLDRVSSPEHPSVVLVLKPRDETVDAAVRHLEGFRKTERWPPLAKRDWRPWKSTFSQKVRGWMFWPRQELRDIRRDDDMLSHEFRQAMTHCYRRGNVIVFVDEAHAVQNDLKLRPEMDAIMMRGRSLGCSGWFATQRPRNVTLNMYSQAEHLVLFRTPDDRDTDVYRQIGGVDSKVIVDAVYDLERFSFVYIGRTKGEGGDATLVVVRGD